MQVKEIMSRDVEVVMPDTSIRDAAEKMRALDLGPLPVCDGDRIVGMVTDRDITVRATRRVRPEDDPGLRRDVAGRRLLLRGSGRPRPS